MLVSLTNCLAMVATAGEVEAAARFGSDAVSITCILMLYSFWISFMFVDSKVRAEEKPSRAIAFDVSMAGRDAAVLNSHSSVTGCQTSFSLL